MHNVRYMRRLSASPLRSMLAMRTLPRKYRIASSMISFLSTLKARNEMSKKEKENKADMNMNTHTLFLYTRDMWYLSHLLTLRCWGCRAAKTSGKRQDWNLPDNVDLLFIEARIVRRLQTTPTTNTQKMHIKFVQIPIKSKRILTTSWTRERNTIKHLRVSQ